MTGGVLHLSKGNQGGQEDKPSTSLVFIHGGESMYYKACFQDLWQMKNGSLVWEKVWSPSLCPNGGGKVDRECAPAAGSQTGTSVPKQEGYNSSQAPSAGHPRAMRGHSMVLLEKNLTLVVFGGQVCTSEESLGENENSVWAFDLRSGRWGDLSGDTATDARPAARWLHTAVMLPEMEGVSPEAMYVHGGFVSETDNIPSPLNGRQGFGDGARGGRFRTRRKYQ
eukprot:CAMPEP_0196598314 /NCGR_PEP_ID=MMETSP1081-20130531/94249_1 /TAXON_ID=36882 /ORGANISM="Pyramimonas amylifera, Strain CCMP720" /LENGTH=223 /DNA_ID=CAMNT_0041923991 /DNA_START=283 /DNA_END=954 /DNA_ORIENTATION=-